MSRKSRERREKNKAVRPDDYFSNGTFEMARFRKTTIVRNNRTPEQHAAQMEYLRTEYASKYEDIAQKVKSLKEKVTQCDPYSLLMYLRSLATMGQMNIFSEIEYSSDANAIIRAQEYVQSIFVSTENNYVPSEPNEEAALHAQIVADFDELYSRLLLCQNPRPSASGRRDCVCDLPLHDGQAIARSPQVHRAAGGAAGCHSSAQQCVPRQCRYGCGFGHSLSPKA